MRARLLTCLLAAAALALAAAGCGVGAGKAKQGGVELRVTRDFGSRELGKPARADKVRDSDTVMRLLMQSHKVKTRYGGGFVASIDGLAGRSASQHRDWFYFVNGIEAPTGAADRALHPGDVVQWDYRDWSAAMRVPAIVGAYPEPFLHGVDGKRFPVRIECAEPSSSACKAAGQKLSDAGIGFSPSEIGISSGGQTLRVAVGRASELASAVSGAALLRAGPQRSGVYAKLADGWRRLELLGPDGKVVRTAPPGTGLVAATEAGGDVAPTWLVTGVDDAGVARAVAALDPAKLENAYAVAAEPSGIVKLPLAVGGSA